jgi:hypothetical protein
MLVNAKIERFVSFGHYIDNEFVGLFSEAGIEVNIKDRPLTDINYLD